jgi:hypothetical protein
MRTSKLVKGSFRGAVKPMRSCPRRIAGPNVTRVGSFSAQRTPDCAAGGSCRGSQAGAARFPGVLLSRWPLRACCYRSGSADAARSRATALTTFT